MTKRVLACLSIAMVLSAIASTAVAQLPVTDGLQMWFEGSNYDEINMTWTDMSGNGNDAIVVDGLPTKVTSSAFNDQNVVHFDNDEIYGVDSLGISFDVSTFDVNNNTTFIVGQTDSAVNGSLLYLGNYASYSPNWHWWGYSTFMRASMPTHQQDRAAFGGYDGTESTILSQGTGNLNTPFLFTGIGSSEGREFLIDGVSQGTTPAYSPQISSEANLWIGKTQGNTDYWNGDIAEIIVFNRALSATEYEQVNTYLTNKYAIPGTFIDTPEPEPEPQLMGRWSFNDGTANDSVGTANGTVYGAVIADGRATFDGVDDVIVTSETPFKTDTMSMVAWVSVDTLDQFMAAAYLTQGSDFAEPGTGNAANVTSEQFMGISLGERTANQWMSASENWWRTVADNGGELQTTTGEDVMVAVCLDKNLDNLSTVTTIYVDGEEYASYESANFPPLFDPENGAHVLLGRHMNGNDSVGCLDGSINEVRLYNYALSLEEVAEMYTLGADYLPGEIVKVPGDANNDGKVDGSDVTILAGNWQAGVGAPDPETITWEMGDFNGDGQVDGSDVTILAGNWQYGVESAASAVPEPSMTLLVLGALAFLPVLRRNR